MLRESGAGWAPAAPGLCSSPPRPPCAAGPSARCQDCLAQRAHAAARAGEAKPGASLLSANLHGRGKTRELVASLQELAVTWYLEKHQLLLLLWAL